MRELIVIAFMSIINQRCGAAGCRRAQCCTAYLACRVTRPIFVPVKQIVNDCFRVCPITVGKETFSKNEHSYNKRQDTRLRHRNIVCEAIIQDHPLSEKLFS